MATALTISTHLYESGIHGQWSIFLNLHPLIPSITAQPASSLQIACPLVPNIGGFGGLWIWISVILVEEIGMDTNHCWEFTILLFNFHNCHGYNNIRENLEALEEDGHEFYTPGINITFFTYKIPRKFIDLLWIDKFLLVIIVNFG